MRKTLALVVPAVLLSLLVAGCAGPEKKLGRGMANFAEITRWSEFNRSMEQHGLRDGADVGMATGAAEGVPRVFARTGLGIYEVLTFPIPPYHPIMTKSIPAKPRYPDAYQPRKWSEAVLDTDHSLGFSGGDIAPWFPGSRFRVFDN